MVPFVVQDTINFAIFASSATSVSLVLFTEKDLQAGCTTHEIKLSPQLNRTGGVWHIMLPKLDTSLLYGQTPKAGSYKNSLKLTCQGSWCSRLLCTKVNGVICRI